MAKQMGPSKTDLLKALKLYEREDPPVLKVAKEKEDKAEEAVAQFLSTNEEYIRLKKLEDVASENRYRLEREHHRIFESLLRKIRNAIYTKGATPSTIKMVQNLENFFK